MAYHSISGGPGSWSGSSSNSGLQFLNSPFGDTTYTKVFVGGLAWETQSETLHHHFQQFGEILEAVVITDKNTGRSKGYGFVTFSDPEAATRACLDPSPVIDGRRANCNLASLGRPQQSPQPVGTMRAVTPFYGGVQGLRVPYIANPTYTQSVPYSYQQGLPYPPYVYTTYGSEYAYPQGLYSPNMGQHYLQMHGMPGAVNSTIYPYGQLRQPLSSPRAYTAVQGYTMPGHHLVQFGGYNVDGITAARVPTLTVPYPTGVL
ncbi:RNA-binding protein 38-like isoform X2 [Papaver somniferum]|uniref:RNA-binding protein 38-like isoform X2 n=1 Tax=Papaver somniferum TaxID=3469 RepID=UPI000E6FAB85|nr:RNA-binding protein 38-like isoform X2 [Papaver somniferum]